MGVCTHTHTSGRGCSHYILRNSWCLMGKCLCESGRRSHIRRETTNKCERLGIGKPSQNSLLPLLVHETPALTAIITFSISMFQYDGSGVVGNSIADVVCVPMRILLGWPQAPPTNLENVQLLDPAGVSMSMNQSHLNTKRILNNFFHHSCGRFRHSERVETYFSTMNRARSMEKATGERRTTSGL